MAKKPKPDPAPAPSAKDSKDSKAKGKKKNAKQESPDDSAPAKPQRGLAIGDNFGWTGKLPATLLIEHCQKQKWNKVVFDMKKTAKGFVGVVNLSWKNPKTNQDIHIRWSPEPEVLSPRETTNEARHFAATYAMYRLNHVKNLKMVLPVIFRDFWGEMDTRRQSLFRADRVAHDRYYNPNPFQVHLDKVMAMEKKEKERQVRENSESKVRKPTISVEISSGKLSSGGNTKTGGTARNNNSGGKSSSEEISGPGGKPPKPTSERPSSVSMLSFPIGKKAWAAAPFVDFPSDLRNSIESSIQHHISWIESDNSPDPAHKQKWASNLSSLGFRPSHVDEALSHTATFVDALEWLLFHVPEDDLPAYFAKRDEDSSVSLKISKDLQTEYLLQRLMLSGYDKDMVWETYVRCGKHESRTIVALTHMTIGIPPVSDLQPVTDSQKPSEDSFELWQMELNGIEIIGANKVELSHTETVALISLNVKGLPSKILSVKLVYTEHYPHVMPGVQIVVTDPSFKLANYIKKAVLRALHAHIQDSQIYGDGFIYSLLYWLEQNVLSVIENPGPLVSDTSRARDQTSTSSSVLTKTPRKSRKPFSQTEISAAKEAYEKRLESPQWKEKIAQRMALPAYKMRDTLVDVITNNQVTLVTGETGSGKSTQIVQFILDHMCSAGDFKSSIICTQPRRISTIGLAERISVERVQDVGKETGYIIRGENKTGPSTRLSFVTTGVLLRMLQGVMAGSSSESHDSNENARDVSRDPFSGVSYVFIDEVHERSVDSDFLLIILKTLLKKKPNLKVVLMSATINTDVFMNYFDTKVHHLHIEGRTFPIQDVYLDEILADLDYSMETYDGIIKPKANSNFFKTGQLNFDLIAKTCFMIDDKLTTERNSGSILVFLPGIMEINRCISHVEAVYSKSSKTCWCLPLHSALSSKDQTRVFQNAKSGARKIVVSTNIAETSITIPDCVVVIDSGRQKSMIFDSKSNQSRLIEDWCSRAEMAQRRGRSGRIQAGTCYHMYTQETQEGTLAQPIPEIKRTKLENLYLVVKSMGVSYVQEFLKNGLDPPEAHSLAKAKSMLMELGAVASDGPNLPDKLTHLGKYLSYLPTDLHAGKLLVLGCIFGCVDMSLTLSAVSASGSPFSGSYEIQDQVKRAKAKFGSIHGDLIASALAYHEWEKLDRPARKAFISENHLGYMALQEIQSTRVQYLSTLKELGFVPFEYRNKDSACYGELNRNGQNYSVVRALITGSFTPQLARVQLPDTKYTKSLVGAVEVDSDARQTKFWIRNEKYIGELENSRPGHHFDELPAARAFVHPSSMLFSDGTAGRVPNTADTTPEPADNDSSPTDSPKPPTTIDLTPSTKFSSANAIHKSPFIVYNSANYTSKLFLRDITPTSTIAAILFGGDISYDISDHVIASKKCPGIVLDRWMPIRTWCKNGVLLKRLRMLLDQVIENKLSQSAGPDDDKILDIISRVLK